MGWYSDIARDISNIPKAIAHYESELQEARLECKIKGNVEKASASMPGIVEQRFNQLQELEAILEYLNIELRRWGHKNHCNLCHFRIGDKKNHCNLQHFRFGDKKTIVICVIFESGTKKPL